MALPPPLASSSPELSDTEVYEPEIRARLETAAHLWEEVLLRLRTPPRTSRWSGIAEHEADSYMRLTDSCITQLKSQRPSRTCNESKEEEDIAEHAMLDAWFVTSTCINGSYISIISSSSLNKRLFPFL